MLELPHYTLLERLHDGSTRVLYRGTRERDGAPVVIKLPKGEYPHPRTIAQLRHEFTILREIEHCEGVVKALALERYGHGLALILKDAVGEPLAARIRSRTLDLGGTLAIAHSLAKILGDVHACGVIHRDVKPQNILVHGSTQEVHLIDFGIATRLSQEAQLASAADALEGTLAYLSPEQTGRMNRLVDYRTDFYSLGVTLYQMLTGVLPFESEDPIGSRA